MEKEKIRILLVEDDEGHAELVIRAFESQGRRPVLTVAKTLRRQGNT